MKQNIILGILFVVGVIVFGGLFIGGTYNGLVGAEESVNNAWGNVQSAYQRRADLIPNVVASVDASAEFEQETLALVTQYRAGIANAQDPQDLEILGREINTAINLAFEAYPDIRTTQAYRDLIVELEGSENRIKRERDLYNDAVREFNTRVRKFPSNVVAGMFGFDQKDYFAAEQGSEIAPDVGELFE